MKANMLVPFNILVLTAGVTDALLAGVCLTLLDPPVTDFVKLILITFVFTVDLLRLVLQYHVHDEYAPITTLKGVVTRTQITLGIATAGLVLLLLVQSEYFLTVVALIVYGIIVALTMLLKYTLDLNDYC